MMHQVIRKLIPRESDNGAWYDQRIPRCNIDDDLRILGWALKLHFGTLKLELIGKVQSAVYEVGDCVKWALNFKNGLKTFESIQNHE